MPSRKDLLHSYQFLVQRVISSVMVHEPDPEQAPLRRGVGAVFAGVMLAALVAVGFGVYGVISGSQGDRWKEEGAIVIERETGAHFVYREGILQPVLNYASARLISGASDPGPHRVAGSNLEGIPRAVMVGIPGAPTSLPERTAGAPWTLCSVLVPDDSGDPVTATALLLGSEPPGGAPLGEEGLLVQGPGSDTVHLVWHRHRHRIAGADPERMVQALYGFQAGVVQVGPAWLDALPAGAGIAPVDLTGLSGYGEESAAVPGYQVGDVVGHPVTGGEQYYLVRDDALVPVTALQMMLLRGEYGVQPAPIAVATAGAAPTVDPPAPPAGEAAPPPEPPVLREPPADGLATLCARTGDAREPPVLTLGADLAAVTGPAALPTGGESATGAVLVDLMLVPSGRVAVVRVLPSPTALTGALHLVTDQGIRHPVPSAEVLEMLGYSPDSAVEMPAGLVQRIPEGPTLDPQAALQPAR